MAHQHDRKSVPFEEADRPSPTATCMTFTANNFIPEFAVKW